MPAPQSSFALARWHVDPAQAAPRHTHPYDLPLLPPLPLGCVSSCTQYVCSYLPHSLAVRMLGVLHAEKACAAQFHHFLRDWQYAGNGGMVGFLHLVLQTLNIQPGLLQI